MDNNDYRVFQILNAIDQDDSVSQRRLADQLNISLGLVNSFVKRLVKKGYFKAVAIPKNRVKYILTPEGAAEKTRLTYNYIKHSYDLYKTSHAKIQDLFKELAMSGVRSVYFFGATDIAEIAFICLKGVNIELLGIIDENCIGETFMGFIVKGFDDLKISSKQRIVLTATEPEAYPFKMFQEAGILANQIVSFDK